MIAFSCDCGLIKDMDLVSVSIRHVKCVQVSKADSFLSTLKQSNTSRLDQPVCSTHKSTLGASLERFLPPHFPFPMSVD